MRFVIPIDRASIKKNPRAGQTVSFVKDRPMTATAKLKSNRILPELDQYLLERTSTTGDKAAYRYKAVFIEMPIGELFKFLESLGCYDIEIHEDLGRSPIMHFPEPPYFFKHVPTEVVCDDCGAKFLNTEFQTYEDDDGGYDQEVCPKCGALSCCDVAYEGISDIELSEGT